MADRNVREPDKALAQRLGRLEERTRAMALRTWSGAIRTEKSGIIEADSPTEWMTVLSLSVTAGRWVVYGHTQLYIPTATAYYDLWMQLSVINPTSGEHVLDDTSNDLPVRRWYQWPYAGQVVMSPVIIGHFVTNDVVTVTLETLNLAGDVYQAVETCVLLLPV